MSQKFVSVSLVQVLWGNSRISPTMRPSKTANWLRWQKDDRKLHKRSPNATASAKSIQTIIRCWSKLKLTVSLRLWGSACIIPSYPTSLPLGKPVATEKPICIRADNARKLVGMAEEKGLLYQVGYMKRHDPASKIARKKALEWKASGEMGEMTYVRITMPSGDWTYEHEPPINRGDSPIHYEGQTGETAPEWMKELGGQYGGFVNFYIHQVNLLRYLIGEDYTVTYVDPRSRILVALSDSGVPCTLEMASYGLRHKWEGILSNLFREWSN